MGLSARSIAFAAALVAPGCVTTAPFNVSDKYVTCSQVDSLLVPDSNAIRAMSDIEAMDFGINVERCFLPGSTRPSEIMARVRLIRDSEKQMVEADNLQREIVAMDSAKRFSTCSQSRDYKLHLAETAIVSSRLELDQLASMKDKQRSYANESGVRNLDQERAIGERTVNTRDRLWSAYQTYIDLGGKTKDVIKIRARANPCQ